MGLEKSKVKLETARHIARSLVSTLQPVCDRIEIAGSIRRCKELVGDIELLAIPQFREWGLFSSLADFLDLELKDLILQGVLGYRLNKRGSRVYGPKNKLLVHTPSGVDVDIFSTTEECWAVSLAIRTGPKESNIAIARAAQRKGWRFRAYGDGFDTPDGHIHCNSEQEVFEAVGLPYLPPEERV